MSIANALEQQMLELINQERTNAGLSALVFNGNLNDSSEDHSLWMLDRDIFSHTGIDGTSSNDRMVAAGFPFEGNYSSGENIAWQSERGAPGLEDDVIDLHNSLMQSPGHRANILNPNFETIGLGIEAGDFGTSGSNYDSLMVTQNFASTDADISVDTPVTPTPTPIPDPEPDPEPVDMVEVDPVPTPVETPDPVDTIEPEPEADPEPVDAAGPDATPEDDPDAEPEEEVVPEPVDTAEADPEPETVDAAEPEETADPMDDPDMVEEPDTDMACGPTRDDKDIDVTPVKATAASDETASDLFDNSEFIAELTAFLEKWDVDLPMVQDCFVFGERKDADFVSDAKTANDDALAGKAEDGGWTYWSDGKEDTAPQAAENTVWSDDWIMPQTEMITENYCSFDIYTPRH